MGKREGWTCDIHVYPYYEGTAKRYAWEAFWFSSRNTERVVASGVATTREYAEAAAERARRKAMLADVPA